MTKTVKKTTKRVKKINPSYTIDITNIHDAKDFIVAKALAKYNAHLPIEEEEFKALVENIIEYTNLYTAVYMVDRIFSDCNGAIIDNGKVYPIDMTVTKLDDDEEMVVRNGALDKVRKRNIFKRFWNWIRRKN